MNNLSGIFCHGGQDEAQTRWSAVPHEVKLHFARAFAHKAGLGSDPGVYSGPPVPEVDDDDEWEDDGE